MGIIHFYEWLFSSFVANGEVILIDELESQGIIRAMLLKRTWLFWLFLLFQYITLIALVAAFNIYSIYYSFPGTLYAEIVVWLVTVLAVFSVFTSIWYLYVFRKTHATDKEYKKLDLLRMEAEKSDRAFARFFNHITLNYFLLFFLIALEIIYVIIVFFRVPEALTLNTFFYLFLSTVSSVAQIFLLQRFRKHMIDLEMDYSFITFQKIYIRNQENMLSTSRVIEKGKMRGMTASFPWYLGSILQYGKIEILMEGASTAIHIDYIDKPTETINRINEIIRRSEQWWDNSFLMMIAESENVDNPKTEDGKLKIREYLHNNEEEIKKEFLSRHPERRVEIESVFKEYY